MAEELEIPEQQVQEPTTDNLLKLHSRLVKDGYELPKYDVFKRDMADPNKLQRLHTTLIKDKYELPDVETFSTDMGYGVKKKVVPSQSSATVSPDVLALQEFAKTLPNGGTFTKVQNKPFNPQEQKATEIDVNVVKPTNLPKNVAREYTHKLKVKEAAVNTLKKNYAQTGQKFDENSPNVKNYIKTVEGLVEDADAGVVDGRDGKPYIVRGAGFGESMVNTTKESFEAPVKAWEINTTRQPKELADKLDVEILRTPNIPESVPTGVGGSFGGLVGGVVKPAALLSLNALTGGLGTAAMVAEGHFTARANQIRQLYQRGLSEGLDRETAARKAMDNADLAALPDDVMNMMLSGAFKGGSPIIGKLPDETFRKYLKNTVEKTAKIGTSGGLAEGGRALIEKGQGYDVKLGETVEKMWDSATEWGKMELGFRIIHGAANAPKYLKSAAKEYIANVPPEIREEYLSRLPEQDAAKIKEQLDSYETARKQVEGLVDEKDISTYAGLMEKRNQLEKEKEGKSKALTEPIDDFIKDIDDRLARMQKTGKVNEVDDITGETVEPVKAHAELSKKEREGIIVPKEYGDTEVIEIGEGENKKYKAKATYKKGDGRIMTSHEIEMEGKEYTDKDKAQTAADEALAKHYYENAMPETDKPIGKVEKVEATKSEEPLPSTEKIEGLKEFAAKSDKHFEYVPIEEIEGYKENDREVDPKGDLDALTEDIKQNGIKKPIQVKVDSNGKALIVEGNTRLAAAKRLGIKNIPVEIIDGEFGSINKDKAKQLPDSGNGEKMKRQSELGLKELNGAYSKGFTKIEPKNETIQDKVQQPTETKSDTVAEVSEDKQRAEKEAKQEAVNDLVDRAQQLQKMRKNEVGRTKELNEIRNKAAELGLEYRDATGKIHNKNGTQVQKKELITNKTPFDGYDRNKYSPETNNAVDNLAKYDDAVIGLEILGTNKQRLSKKQLADAAKSIRDGKPTHGGMAIIDFIDKAVGEGGIAIEDVTTGQRIKVPLKEYLEAFSEPVKELTTEEIDTINKHLENDHFEQELDNLIKHIENENITRENQTSNTGATSTGEKGTESKTNSSGVGGKEPPKEPPVAEPAPKEPAKFDNKSILTRLSESENIKPEIREKFKDDLKYKVKSHEEARKVAKEIITEYGHEDAVALAEGGKFHGDVNSMIFGEALDQLYQLEKDAKTPAEKQQYATQWADVAMRYDEAARSKGRFISAIGDFYRKSPLGIRLKEEANRSEHFKEWFKDKEKGFKEVFEAIKEEPEFKEIISKEVQEQLKKERTESRNKRRKNIEDFFDKAKFKGDATYATIIPPKVINGGIEAMKQAFLAGESVVNAVEKAIDHISKEVKDWDKEKFRKEWEDKLRYIEEKKGGKLSPEELSQQKREKLIERFRKKLKGLSDKEKEEVIRKSFKKLVENGALEYEDFKKIIAETIGLGELTDVQKGKIEKYVADINAVEDAAENARTVRTQASLDAYHKAAKLAERSATDLGEIVYNKPSIINRLTSVMQLNTLGIPSLVNNPIFNIFNQALVRFPKAVQLSLLDKAIQLGGKMLGKDIKPNNDVISAQIPFFKGVGEGAKQSTEQLFTGLTNKDYFQKEVYASQIHPWTSIKDLWQWGKGNKHLSKTQVADKVIQGTIGAPAEVVARLLNIGDKPQRFATEKATAKVIANQYGLKGMDEKLFMDFPKQEAYLREKAKGVSDEVAMQRAEAVEKRIISEGEESTFQQDNIVNEMLNSLGQAYDKISEGNTPFEALGKIGKVFKTMNLPFVKIPLNAFWSYFNLVNPEIALAQSFIYGVEAARKKAKGLDGAAKDFEQSKKWLVHATTGMGLLALTGTLASKGIVSGDNSADDTKKEREGEKNYEQQHSLDMGKLSAWLQGKNPDDVKDGLKVDLKWYGVLGNAANLQANKYEKMDEKQRKEGIKLMGDVLGDLQTTGLEMFQSGVFSNASSLANAFDRGGVYTDAYLTNLINMGTNIVHPAMFAQVSRAKLPYDYTTKADSFGEQIKANMTARSEWGRKLFNKYPPSKIGIWGDELKRNDDWALRWFGMSHSNKDAFAKPLYEDYKKTGDVKFFPPSVKAEIHGQKLNTAEMRQLETLVGQSRKALIAPYVNDAAELPGYGRYKSLSHEEKVKALEILYKQGLDNGVAKFESIHPKYKKPDNTWEQEETEDTKREKNEELRESVKQ